MTTLLLIHGGLWEAGMNAQRFWAAPGIVAGLQRRGAQVLAPDRPLRARSWAAEADHLASALLDRPVTVVAGSNGCSAAVRLALVRPDQIRRLLLAWPPTAGDPAVDARVRADLVELGASAPIIDELLAGQTLRGVTAAELATLQLPVGVLASALRIRSTSATPSRRCSARCDTSGSCPAAPSRPARSSPRTWSGSSAQSRSSRQVDDPVKDRGRSHLVGVAAGQAGWPWPFSPSGGSRLRR